MTMGLGMGKDNELGNNRLDFPSELHNKQNNQTLLIQAPHRERSAPGNGQCSAIEANVSDNPPTNSSISSTYSCQYTFNIATSTSHFCQRRSGSRLPGERNTYHM